MIQSRTIRLASVFLFLTLPLTAENLKYTITGDSQEKADLETLSPDPLIPNADEMSFSLDAGKSALESEVVPLSVAEAALKSDLSNLELPVLPTIPEAPFVVQPAPPATDPQLRLFFPIGKRKEKSPPVEWEFFVVDELNQERYRTQGTGEPPSPLIWDGTEDGDVVIEPDETYLPFLVLKSSAGLTVRIPGEASRYLAFAQKQGEDEVITFGERLYEQDKAAFSKESKIYLMDLMRRLSLLLPTDTTWNIVLFTGISDGEPAALGDQRRKLWKTTLEKTLKRKIALSQFVLIPSQDKRTAARIILKQFKDSSRPVMTGKSRDPRPLMEEKTTWIKIKETEKNMVVEMRHDRLFRQGSAYLRDDVLGTIVDTMEKVKAETKKPVILRSYMTRPKDVGRGKSFEEDPKLAALRSKVLFMLFAQARYLP